MTNKARTFWRQILPPLAEFPQVRDWSEGLATQNFSAFNGGEKSVDVYYHLPFCERHCHFCGCNTVISRDHSWEARYVTALEQEWRLRHPRAPVLNRDRWGTTFFGGGTPTFFSASSWKQLIEKMHSGHLPGAFDSAFFEIDPRSLSASHLELWATSYKSTHLQLGVQDLNHEVLASVGRDQTREQVEASVSSIRSATKSWGIDLMIGLPKQSEKTFSETLFILKDWCPTRVHLYPFWKSSQIKERHLLFSEEDLPDADLIERLWDLARQTFIQMGLQPISDHVWISKDDLLFSSFEQKNLSRHSSGWTIEKSKGLFGLGTGAISQGSHGYEQNVKLLSHYMTALSKNRLPSHRWHRFSENDLEWLSVREKWISGLGVEISHLKRLLKSSPSDNSSREPVPGKDLPVDWPSRAQLASDNLSNDQLSSNQPSSNQLNSNDLSSEQLGFLIDQKVLTMSQNSLVVSDRERLSWVLAFCDRRLIERNPELFKTLSGRNV